MYGTSRLSYSYWHVLATNSACSVPGYCTVSVHGYTSFAVRYSTNIRIVPVLYPYEYAVR